MMNKRKAISLFLALALVCALLPTVALAADSDFVIENGVLTKYKGSGGNVAIPSGVTSIGKNAFLYCRNLTSVTIPEGVTSIGYRAFEGCTSLTSATIPNSVTSIGEHAFYECTSLTGVTIPNGVTSIGEWAFDYCKSLTSVTIPGGVASIEEGTFAGCNSLTSVTIGNGVTSIGGSAFSGCKSLTSVTIPNSVTRIGANAFNTCESLTSVTIPSNVTSIDEGTFAYCYNLTSVTIPDGVTSIGEAAFYQCFGLTSVTIPSSVTSIERIAFSKCTSLTSVAIPTSVTSIGEAAFSASFFEGQKRPTKAIVALTDVYYGGDQAQWEAIHFEPDNERLRSATIHYHSTMPAVPATKTAYASTQTVNVDGKTVTFECYALKEGNGMTNYIKLRDLAMHLNGTAAQFQVGWDGSVTITTKTAYTPNGSELSTPYSGDRAYQEANAATKVNGQAAQLAAFVLNDDNGGGYTYYQLRDLGKALGFNVGWSADKGIFVETNKPYDPAN